MRVGTFVLAAQFPGQGQGEALHRAVRTAEVAEEAGLDSVWLAEHHFVPYGVCPSAVTLAALLLGRTRRLRVGTAVSVLPTVHPVALGEQAALLHLTSGGRFTLGWAGRAVGRPGGVRRGPGGVREGVPRIAGPAAALADRAARRRRGGTIAFREVPVVPRPDELIGGAASPEVVVACTSPKSVRLAAERGLPMLLGMHCLAGRTKAGQTPRSVHGRRPPASTVSAQSGRHQKNGHTTG
ncbi:LLM class flavin-dependent oxidoreductase [Streptomyces tanashiensis]